MKTAILILALVALAAAAPKSTKLGFRNLYKKPIVTLEHKPGPRIINGREASPHSIPFQAFLEVYSFSEGWYCGGSVISENYVATAGHCGDGADTAYVTLGAHRPLDNENTQVQDETSDITVHEGYDGDLIINDIAVIGLSSPVRFSDAIQPVALPQNDNNDYAGDVGRASGWGLTDGRGSSISDVLNYIDLEIISNRECESIFGDLEPSILCTSGDRGSTCSGDSGGPLVVDNALVGITSFGVEYCEQGYPSAFTRVSSFLDWLERNTDVKRV